MSDLPTTPEEMESRIARLKDLKKSPQAFVDTRIPEHARDIYNVIGTGVTEDPDLTPAIADTDGFNLTYVGADPGKGAALHDHPTVEVFIPLNGTWAIIWGENGEHENILEAGDVISVPPGVMRGFRNDGDRHAILMALLGGDNAGKVTWAESVLEKAKETGLSLDDAGNIVETA